MGGGGGGGGGATVFGDICFGDICKLKIKSNKYSKNISPASLNILIKHFRYIDLYAVHDDQNNNNN